MSFLSTARDYGLMMRMYDGLYDRVRHPNPVIQTINVWFRWKPSKILSNEV